MPREGHGSRNQHKGDVTHVMDLSCPARGMGVEINGIQRDINNLGCHAPRGAWE